MLLALLAPTILFSFCVTIPSFQISKKFNEKKNKKSWFVSAIFFSQVLYGNHMLDSCIIYDKRIIKNINQLFKWIEKYLIIFTNLRIFYLFLKQKHIIHLINKISILVQSFSSYWRNIFHPIHIFSNIPSKLG